MKKINPYGVAALAKDVDYLAEFVDSLEVPILRENLDELQQTVQLMQAENTDEFYDVSTRNKKYGRVDAINGPILLEKYNPLPIQFRHDVADKRTGCRVLRKAPQRRINSPRFHLGLG